MKRYFKCIYILMLTVILLTQLFVSTVYAIDTNVTSETVVTLIRGKAISMKPYMGDISGRTLIWSSNNTKIATVNASGVAKGTGVGQCTIMAKTKDGSFTASALLNVTQIYETGIKLSKSKISLNKGKTAILKATLIPSNTDFKAVIWDSDNSNVATVSSKGVVKAINTGTCTITATSTNGKSISCIVTTLPQKVTSVKMGKTASTYSVGQNVKISLTVNPASADNRAVNWTSSKPSVATVDENGNVTFLSGGKVTIKAAAQDGSKKSASKTFTVKQYVSNIDLNATEISIAKGKTYTLKASVTPSAATNKAVTWSTSNKKIATVSSKGVIKGVNNGMATITVKAKDGSGVVARCTVYVGQPVPTPQPSPDPIPPDEGNLKVYFWANGGKIGNDYWKCVSLNRGTALTKAILDNVLPTMSGFDFKGWYTSGYPYTNAEKVDIGSVITSDPNIEYIVFEAKWEVKDAYTGSYPPSDWRSNIDGKRLPNKLWSVSTKTWQWSEDNNGFIEWGDDKMNHYDNDGNYMFNLKVELEVDRPWFN